MTLTPSSSHVTPGPGGGPSAPYTPPNGISSVTVAQDFGTDALITAGADGVGLLAQLPNQTVGVFAAGSTVFSALDDTGVAKIAFFGADYTIQVPATDAALITLGLATAAITSGALPTQQFVSGAAATVSTSRDVEVHTPVTFNPGVATTATCTVELSPDNVTYSTLCVWTEPVGTVLAGTILDVTCRVPAGWRLKLTVNAQAVLGLSTYY